MILSSHDISVVAETCSKIAIMYAGQIVEYAGAIDIFKNSYHPYTLGLQQAFPNIKGTGKKLIAIEGYPPNLINPPKGCRFYQRCPFRIDDCTEEGPPLFEVEPQHFSRCLRYKEIEYIRGQVAKEEVWEGMAAEKIQL